MGLLMAHERWATTRSKLNPGLGRMLRDVGGYLRGGSALVAGEVDGSHAVPILMTGRDRSITIRGGEQQILCHERAPFAFALAAVDAIAGQVLLGVYRPGEIDLHRGWRGFGIFDCGGDDTLRYRGRKRIDSFEDQRIRVARFEFVAAGGCRAADDVDVNLAEIELFVGVARVVGAIQTSKWSGESFLEDVGTGDFGIVC